jgi:hypothetical protein
MLKMAICPGTEELHLGEGKCDDNVGRSEEILGCHSYRREKGDRTLHRASGS